MKPNLHLSEGGIGKQLQFTSLFDKIVEKYDEKLCLMNPWPELFQNDTRVSSSQPLNLAILHDTSHTLFNNYNDIIYKDPYKSNFLKGKSHIIKYWADMYDIKVDNVAPNFQINKKRERVIQPDILKLGKFILVQFTGGQGLVQTGYDEINVGRNYKEGQEVINLLKDALPDVNILVFGHNNEHEPLLNTTQSIFTDKLDFMILAKYCLSFICIDSSLQHMCSNNSFNKKGVVLWGTSSSSMFGYDKNTNLKSEHPYTVELKPNKIVDSFLKLEI